MPQLTVAGARGGVDPILTEVARGYAGQGNLVWSKLFPTVTVMSRGGRITTFDASEFRRYQTRRAPGGKTDRVMFGRDGLPFALDQFSLEGMVPVEIQEEAAVTIGIDEAARALASVQAIMENQVEFDAAALATTAGNFGANTEALTGTGRWDDPASNPITKVSAWRETVRGKIGKRPNVMVVGPAVHAALVNHPVILDRLKYTSTALADESILSALFQMDYAVGDAIQASDADVLSDVWGKNVVLAYTVPRSMADRGSPSFGYTYQLSGRPFAETAYLDRSHKSVILPVTDERKAVIAGASAGFLGTTVVS